MSELNIDKFKFNKIKIKTFSEKELKQIIFKDITSDEIDHVTEFDTDYQPDELSVIQYFTKKTYLYLQETDLILKLQKK